MSTTAPATSNGHPEEPDVLDLVSLAPTRRLVKLPTKKHPEGERFELRMLEDFGIEDQQKLLAWSKRHAELMSGEDADPDTGELSDKLRERLRFLHDNLFDMVLTAPATAKKTMSDGVKNTVIRTFSWGPVLANQESQTALIKKLIEMEFVTQRQVDEAIEMVKSEALSTLAN